MRTLTIDVPDELGGLYDKVIARWMKLGKSPEETLRHVLRHGLEMMDIPEGKSESINEGPLPF